MAKNVSFNEQEHHILMNNNQPTNNVPEDGTLINDKNKVDFTIGNNQLNDGNINKVGTSKLLTSKWVLFPDQVFMINQIKFFHYHKAKQINVRRSLLTTHHKNQCIINARERLKHKEDCNNINDQ